ncbi:hypothetical protein SDC9_72072 [bioreactor metagenome]|uniref:Uncharacterized protein n=1 Tax=bioreactor metagenome TaxID=1076179 RepID=A0A644YAI7_9ZZZZ
MAIATVYLCPLLEELVVGYKTGAYIYTVNALDDLFGTRYWFEIFTPGDYGSRNSGMIFIWYCFQKDM